MVCKATPTTRSTRANRPAVVVSRVRNGSEGVIHVLEGGRMVESGTHDELVSRDGAYASLCAVQTGAAVRHGAGRADRELKRARPS